MTLEKHHTKDESKKPSPRLKIPTEQSSAATAKKFSLFVRPKSSHIYDPPSQQHLSQLTTPNAESVFKTLDATVAVNVDLDPTPLLLVTEPSKQQCY